MSNISGVPQPPPYYPPPIETHSAPFVGGYFPNIWDKFQEAFKWVSEWFTGEVTPGDPAYELTPQQKQTIEDLYFETLRILKEIDNPADKEEVRAFLQMLLQFYKKMSELKKEEADMLQKGFERTRVRVQDFQKKEQGLYDKMIEDAKRSTVLQKITDAIVPLYTIVGAALSLPPGLNVAVVCAVIILAADHYAGDPLKQTMAEKLAGDDQEDQQLYFQRIRTMSSLISFGLAIPVSVQSMSLSAVFALVSFGTGMGKLMTDRQKNERMGDITLAKSKSEEWGRKLNKAFSDLNEVNKSHQRMTTTTMQLVKDQDQTARGIFNKG